MAKASELVVHGRIVQGQEAVEILAKIHPQFAEIIKDQRLVLIEFHTDDEIHPGQTIRYKGNNLNQVYELGEALGMQRIIRRGSWQQWEDPADRETVKD